MISEATRPGLSIHPSAPPRLYSQSKHFPALSVRSIIPHRCHDSLRWRSRHLRLNFSEQDASCFRNCTGLERVAGPEQRCPKAISLQQELTDVWQQALIANTKEVELGTDLLR